LGHNSSTVESYPAPVMNRGAWPLHRSETSSSMTRRGGSVSPLLRSQDDVRDLRIVAVVGPQVALPVVVRKRKKKRKSRAE